MWLCVIANTCHFTPLCIIVIILLLLLPLDSFSHFTHLCLNSGFFLHYILLGILLHMLTVVFFYWSLVVCKLLGA